MNTTTNTTKNSNTNKNHRARWAAIGAAVAVSVGAGGIGLVGAASPDGASMFVGTNPCRVLDTRANPDLHIGPFGAIGPNSKITVTAKGDVGQCTGANALPSNAAGLQLNVTPIGATAPTNLRVYPGAGTPPNASSLNPTPGQPPIPNAVTVELDDNGQFSIYNFQGTVDVAVDVVGYFADNFQVPSQQLSNEPGVSFNDLANPVALNGADQTVLTTEIRVPSDGYLNVQVTGRWHPQDTGATPEDIGRCQLTLGTTFDGAAPFITLYDFNAATAPTGQAAFSGHRTMPISAAGNPPSVLQGQSVRLVCAATSGVSAITAAHLTAEFVPTSYEPHLLEIA